MSTEGKLYYHMFCNDDSRFAYETDSGFDNASCSAESTQSNIEEEICKCTELQNPSIMQYYPTWEIAKTQVAKADEKTCECKQNQNTQTRTKESDTTDYESDTDCEIEFSQNSFVTTGLPKNVINDVQLSVILIGDSNTGKTSLVARFADDKLIEDYETTIGIDFSIARFRLNGTRVRLQLWDTAGQEKFNAITTQYYHRAMGVVFVYDVTKQSSFDSILRWNRAVELHADPDVVKLLCGNKMDLDEKRKVTTEQGRKLAYQIGARFCEVSALETTNVFEAFSLFSRDVFLEYYAKRNPCASPTAVRLNPVPAGDNKKGCCS
ncbi:ras-related protein Rab-13-like [Amphiura filiformis]|uniref:ras-related protein Rab-13-like n=1 Tax=Amphiura filiformis TaxID=82378 RepID=UPI003B221758